ncbi:MAG: hypothetical protein FWG74_09230 [Planctomycetes bacterium]|nr:hypothetical protein [Planctomycetota bacterium]
MSAQDYDDKDDAEGEADDGEASASGAVSAAAAPLAKPGFRNWMSGQRGWIMIIALTVIQGLFAVILMVMRDDVKPRMIIETQAVQDFAIEMLGREVVLTDIFQSIPVRGGKRVAIGMEITLVLGQLPVERIVGAERPTDSEMERFIVAIQEMEPNIRSRLNTLLLSIPPERFGRVEVFRMIKDDIQEMVNDGLERLDFGKTVRPGIDKRRVTEVLVPLFLRQP